MTINHVGDGPEVWARDRATARGAGVARGAGRLALKLLVLAAVVAAGAWAYRANVTGGATMDMNMRISQGGLAAPVTVAAVERGPMAGTVTYTGSVAPYNEEDVYPRVTGRIVEMSVYPGDAVRAGQLLARLDDVELSSRVRESEAMLASAQAGRTQMEADLVAAQHDVTQMEKELAMVEAELDYARGVAARSEKLVRSGAISQQEYESERSMAASLEAKREAARARLERARAMELAARRKLDAAGAMVAQGQAAVRTAEVVRDYVTIVAPSAGVVVKRLVAPGVLVQPGMPILKLAQIDRVRLQANVAERDLPAIRVGSAVTVTPAGTGQAPFTARVTAVFPFVDQGPRTAVVEAVVDNQGRRLLPGQYVQMQLTTGERPSALSVPRGAVVRGGGTATVWVVNDEQTERRPVTTGLESGDRVEILQGLAAGERVIVRGHDGLYAGARVREVAMSGTPASRPAGAAGEGHGAQGGHGAPATTPRAPAPKAGGHAGH